MPKLENVLNTEELNKLNLERNTYYQAEAQERAWQAIRNKRGDLLAATDWAALPDSPANTPEMLAYRQALRDLPNAYANPDDVVWPANPLGGA